MKIKKTKLSRRAFLALTSGAAAAGIVGVPAFSTTTSSSRQVTKKKLKSTGKPNILFIFGDQERRFKNLPSAFALPGHERLSQQGTTFTSHYISSCMCTSSRSVMLTGLQTVDNGMFENVDMPYVQNLSTEIPTFGHMLRQAGYYTAYKGKWHLNRDFEEPKSPLGPEMEKYGFADFNSPGDGLAHDLGGYEYDHLIAGNAISWLRSKGSQLNAAGNPWSLTVSLINPHDIMYFNADAPGENVQDTGKLLMHAARAPDHENYRADWNYPLPTNLREKIDHPGRPAAHAEYLKAWGYCLGNIPLKDENWNRFTNFYLNSIRSVDTQIEAILTELEKTGLSENTIVIYTADHGEMGGSHGLRGKGPFAYNESLNVPFYIIHPDVPGGQQCDALTSHIDIVPTLLNFAGVDPQDISSIAGRSLAGKSMASVLANPASAGKHDVRDQSLFVYSGISTNDSEVIRIIAEAKANGQDPKEALKNSGYKPDLKKRGSLRSVFDGRYKFTRYFAPTERNLPTTLEELFAHNDVELFDLQNDAEEMNNLAIDKVKNAQLIMQMNAKLELAIAQEIGKDDGREMPDFPGIDWCIDRLDL